MIYPPKKKLLTNKSTSVQKQKSIQIIKSSTSFKLKPKQGEKQRLLKEIQQLQKIVNEKQTKVDQLTEKKQQLDQQCTSISHKLATIRNQIRKIKNTQKQGKNEKETMPFKLNKPRIKTNQSYCRDYYQDNIDPDKMTYEELLMLQQQIGSVSKGLNQKQINSLQKDQYQNLGQQVDETCSVCMDEYKGSDSLIILPCNHNFHQQCIKIWVKDEKICPLCKEDIV